MNPKDKPLETYRVQGWKIHKYPDGLLLQNGDGNTYEILSSTETLTRIPFYVLRYMRKRHLLDDWELAQLALIRARITTLREQHERFTLEQQQRANPSLTQG